MPARKSILRNCEPGRLATFPAYFEPVKSQLELVRRHLRERLLTGDEGLNRQLDSVGAGRGKLFRSAIVLLSGKACGSLRQEHIDLAAIVELVHTATLLHDDVIDKAGTRRGGPAANVLWGNTAAVLMGDFLLSRAFLAGAGLNIPQAARVLSQTAEQICQGELLQNLRRGCWQMSQQEYFEIIQAKTASLFAAGCYLAALGSAAREPVAGLLSEYGRCLGLAFQITDDILDITGDSTGAGKTLRTDLAQRKPTLPVIHFLQQHSPDDRDKLAAKLTGKLAGGRLALLLERSGSLEYARQKAKDFACQAARALASVKPGPARESLERLADAIGQRA